MLKFFIFTIFFTACAPKLEPKGNQIVINLQRDKSRLDDPTSNFWGHTISTLDDFNCFGVMASYSAVESGICSSTANPNVSEPNTLGGFVSSGSNIVITVPAGNVKLQVAALYSSDGVCPNLNQIFNLDQDGYSAPYLVSSGNFSIQAGNQTLTIPISLTGSHQLVNCTGGPFLTLTAATWGSAIWGSDAWAP